MKYIAKRPPSIEDPNIQIWSVEIKDKHQEHWIANVRERAWPGTVETVLAALNKHDYMCKMLADYQKAVGDCYEIMGLVDTNIEGLKNAIQIMMDDRYRLNDEIKKVANDVEKETAEKCIKIAEKEQVYWKGAKDRKIESAGWLIAGKIIDEIATEFNV